MRLKPLLNTAPMRYLAFVFGILLFSCTKSGGNEDLSANQSKWNKKNICNYEFTLSIGCFCPETVAGPHLIKVVDDTIASVNGLPYDAATMSMLMTIDELFAFVRRGIDRDPYQKSITYNSLYGYPESFYFDFEKTMADEEIGYQITGFIKN
jgi:hypothetical protein